LTVRPDYETPVKVRSCDFGKPDTCARKCAQVSAPWIQIFGNGEQDLIWEVEKLDGTSHSTKQSLGQPKGEKMPQALQYADFTILAPTVLVPNIVKWGDRRDSDDASPARQKK
jgi:hypothetical protein